MRERQSEREREIDRNCRWLLVIFNASAACLLIFIFVAVSCAAFAAFLCVRHPFVIKNQQQLQQRFLILI